jgi:hypothetical protein
MMTIDDLLQNYSASVATFALAAAMKSDDEVGAGR